MLFCFASAVSFLFRFVECFFDMCVQTCGVRIRILFESTRHEAEGQRVRDSTSVEQRRAARKAALIARAIRIRLLCVVSFGPVFLLICELVHRLLRSCLCVNHMQAHILAHFIGKLHAENTYPEFPFLCCES